MAWVVFTVLLGIAFWVGVAMFVTGKRDAELRHDQLGARTIGAIVATERSSSGRDSASGSRCTGSARARSRSSTTSPAS